MASRKKIRQSASVYVFQVFNYCFLTALVLMCLYPMWYCLMASFSKQNDGTYGTVTDTFGIFSRGI